MTLLVGVSAKKGGGKSTVGNSLLMPKFCAENPGLYVRLYNYADRLKSFLNDFFEVPLELMYGSDEDKNTKLPNILWENMPGYREFLAQNDSLQARASGKFQGPMTVREFMQFGGTEIIRKISPDAHVRGCLNQIEKDAVDVALVLDMRFLGEAQAIKQRKGYTVRLTRNVAGNDAHSSETDLDNYQFDHVIDNANLSVEQTCEAFQNYVLGLPRN